MANGRVRFDLSKSDHFGVVFLQSAVAFLRFARDRVVLSLSVDRDMAICSSNARTGTNSVYVCTLHTKGAGQCG